MAMQQLIKKKPNVTVKGLWGNEIKLLSTDSQEPNQINDKRGAIPSYRYYSETKTVLD
jgi:hypothetical protein